jgi:ribosomal protein L3 glutamine methyltransferase
MTILDWVNKCRQELENSGVWFGHGTDNASDEAAWLVLAALSKPLDESFTDWANEVTEGEQAAIVDLLQKRIQSRKPLAYLTGKTWFCGHKFFVDENVLIPRSPIAELIQNGFAPWGVKSQLSNILDMCTGSACIGIATALALTDATIDAVDISSSALQVAQKNVELHGLNDRVRLIKSDLFASLAVNKYDLIIANPPYVSKQELESLPSEYHAEPAMALLTGMNGLEIPLKILCQSSDFLASDGVLICEVGENADLLQSTLPALPMTWIEFEHGGSGVFVLERKDLVKHRQDIETALEKPKNVA